MRAIRDTIKSIWQRSIMHRALLVAPPVVFLLAAGFLRYGVNPKSEYYDRVVDRGPIEQVVSATGTINAVTTVQVGSQVSGNIAELYADFNSKVRKGQVIAQIDPSTFRARLLQAEADLENAKANVKSLEAQTETQRADIRASKASVERARAQANEAELQLKRTAELAEQGILSTAQKDTAQANYDAAAASLSVTEAQLQQSEARLKAMQAQLEQAKAQVLQRKAAAEMSRVDLSHTTIQAPIDGTVIARNVDVGQTVAASLQAPTLFIIAQDLTKMQVYAKTDEADVGRIKVGATARFRVDSFPRREFRGQVAQVRMNATTVQNVVTYDTIIEFDNPNQMLFPGMTAYVTIPVEFVDDAIRIPNGALRFKPEITEEERKALFAKYQIPEEGTGLAKRMAGSPGARDGGARGGSGGGGNRGGGSGATGEGGGPSQEARRRMMMASGGFGGGREQWGVVWKRPPKNPNEIIPVRVKLGVTDFTVTELKEGDIKEGDRLVIGQSTERSEQQQMAAPGSPMGRPRGVPRRM